MGLAASSGSEEVLASSADQVVVDGRSCTVALRLGDLLIETVFHRCDIETATFHLGVPKMKHFF